LCQRKEKKKEGRQGARGKKKKPTGRQEKTEFVPCRKKKEERVAKEKKAVDE